MFHRNYWKSVRGDKLLKLITAASAVAISFEGISQGIMGVVTVSPEFGRRMGYMDENGDVTNPTLQGGIAAIYYLYVLILPVSSSPDYFTQMTDLSTAELC
jgi:hypothetical protein